MQSLREEMQSQMNKPGREGETAMIHPGARHDIINESYLSKIRDMTSSATI